MTSPFQVTATLPVAQVSQQLQLPIEAPSAQFQNTSSSASVTINAAGPALLDPPAGTVLAPGQSATVALQGGDGGILIASAIATGPGATVLVTMQRETLQIGGLTIEAPGAGQD
jgi:hypothetical protein